jgi:hypothetical protein
MLDGSTETGAEGVGSDFSIWRCNNAGVGVQQVLALRRTDGAMTAQQISCTYLGVTATYGRMSINCASNSQNSALTFTAGNLPKWDISTIADATQSLQFIRYDDAGNAVASAFGISRTSGECFTAMHPISALGVCTKGYADTKLSTGGGTVNGSVYIAGSNYPTLFLQKDINGAGGCQVAGNNLNGQYRWVLNLGDSAPEQGGHTGMNFALSRFSDQNQNIDAPITITRSNGYVNMTQFLLTRGYQGRRGYDGVSGGNIWNFWWNGYLEMWIDNVYVGQVSYTSDYRVKKDIAPLASMWDKVKALKPISYSHKEYAPSKPPAPVKMEKGGEYPSQHPTGDAPAPMFKEDDKERWGFVAHELQETLILDAATGVKDQADCIQSPNPWTMLAAVTKALQEAMVRIEALEKAVGINAAAKAA